ncbi:MAG: hypothetical protein AAB482_03295 [Patescibacteria group bacterium]
MKIYARYVVASLDAFLVLFYFLKLESHVTFQDFINNPQEGVFVFITIFASYFLWKRVSILKGWPFKIPHFVEENLSLLLLMQLLHIVLIGVIYVGVMFGFYFIAWSIVGFS